MNELPEWIKMDEEGFFGLLGPVYRLPTGARTSRFRFLAEPKHANRSGFVHGGMLAAFADRGLGMTARQSDLRRRVATVQLDVHFLQPAQIGETVEMNCRVIRETRTLIFLDGAMSAASGEIAIARGVWKLIESKPRSSTAAMNSG